MSDAGAHVILLDLEYTAWEGSMARGWSRPGEHREIVEIGAIQIDTRDLLETRAFSRLILPRINSELSGYLTNLTGITNSMLAAEGADFAPALRDLAAFVEEKRIYAYGLDTEVLNENIDLYDLGGDFVLFEGIDIRGWIYQAASFLRGRSSSQLAHALGLDFGEPSHRALSDARSLRAAVAHLVAQGATNPFVIAD